MNSLMEMAGPAVRFVAASVLACVFTLFVIVCSGAPPLRTLTLILEGGAGSWVKLAQSLSVWVPLVVCSSALLLTFASGLWNIGVEGQIVLGAIFATGLFRCIGEVGGPPAIALGLLAGMLGGGLWGLISAVLRVWGRVHEIFSGLGLNFVAISLCLWLIFGPWKRPGIASMSGTEPLPESLWLRQLDGLPLCPVSLALSVAVFVAVFVLIKYTRWGLMLRAVGQNPQAADIMGLSPHRRHVEAMMCAGGLAGLAGALQVVGLYHQLLPAISSGYGYTSLLVTMMASFRGALVPPLCFCFAVLNVGSIQLPLRMSLDSSLGDVIQGALVLSMLLVQGLDARIRRRHRGVMRGDQRTLWQDPGPGAQNL
jgi:simple sugar transport system permease protein